jgi:hypothetical protein
MAKLEAAWGLLHADRASKSPRAGAPHPSRREQRCDQGRTYVSGSSIESSWMSRAGLPPTSVLAATFEVTIEPAATTAFAPIATPGKDDHVTSEPCVSPDRDWCHACRMVARHFMEVRVVDRREVADFSVVADRDFALCKDVDPFVDEDVVADDEPARG